MEGFESWKDLLYFNKSERRGLAFFFVLILAVVFLPTFFHTKPETKDLTQHFEEEFAQLETVNINEVPTSYDSPKNDGASSQKATITQIENEPEQAVATNVRQNDEETRTSKEAPKNQVQAQLVLDVNKASAEDFAKLRGIGPVLSSRIVKFRDGLGGFSSINQVGDTFGLEPEVFVSIKPSLIIAESPQLKKINLNQASLDQLKSHPYISEKLANQIINYREKVHPFEHMDDVKALYLVDDELFSKLKPYVTY